jgi:diguanylate cyclase
MTEIAARGFAINPLVFAVFYNLASGEQAGLKEAFEKIDLGGKISQADAMEFAREHLFDRDSAVLEKMVAEFEQVLQAISKKLSMSAGEELEKSLKTLVKEAGSAGIPDRMKTALVGVVKNARAVADRDKAVVEDVKKTVNDVQSLRDELNRARDEAERYRLEARSDQLTGVSNRRAFDELAAEIFSAKAPRNRPVSVLMLDIDHFKKVNDSHGHEFGDFVLKEVARRIGNVINDSGKLYRLGGEEFCVIYEGIGLIQARQISERVRAVVSSRTIPEENANGPKLKITLSGGVTEKRMNDSAETMMDRADKLLYQAKQGGRDRIGALA